MSDQNAALPVAGWYPDPEHDGQDRWWDGANWADHRRPRGGAAAAPAAPSYAYVPAGTPEPYGANGAPSGAVAQQPYGVVPQPYGYSYAPAAPQNVPALVGFILAIVGFVLGFIFYGIIGLAGGIVSIVGLVKANQLRRAGVPTHRWGMALTGVIVGFAAPVLTILVWGLFLTAAMSSSSYYGY